MVCHRSRHTSEGGSRGPQAGQPGHMGEREATVARMFSTVYYICTCTCNNVIWCKLLYYTFYILYTKSSYVMVTYIPSPSPEEWVVTCANNVGQDTGLKGTGY